MNGRIRNVVMSVAAVALLAGGLVACGNDDGDEDGNGDGPPEGMVATFRVADTEEYRILLTDPEHIELAQRWLDGEEGPYIPNGLVVRGATGVNEGWSWHIDPDDLEFAEMTIEVCDGRPSHVEDETITSDRFCPWSAEIIGLEDV